MTEYTPDSPLVSIVIPAFNEEKTLPSALEKIAKQTYSHFEVIIADNNSTDKTSHIAWEFGAKVIPVTKLGYVYALNAGMKSALGEIIAVTDADTLVYPNWLEEIVQTFTYPDIVGVTGSIQIAGSGFQARTSDFFYSIFLAVNFLIGKPHLVGFNFAVLRKPFSAIGGLDERFIMSPDVDLGMRLKKHGRIIYNRQMKVSPSLRRWKNNPVKAIVEYARGYFYAIWLRTPLPVKQEIIR